jgi:hypothetical protein
MEYFLHFIYLNIYIFLKRSHLEVENLEVKISLEARVGLDQVEVR